MVKLTLAFVTSFALLTGGAHGQAPAVKPSMFPVCAVFRIPLLCP